MSELIAEARVLIRPDLTGFRAALEAEVNAAVASTKIKPVVIPVTTTAATTGTQQVVKETEKVAAAQAAQALSGEQASRISARRAEVLKLEAASARSAAVAEEQLARANDIVSVTERRVAGTTGTIAQAQARYAASIRVTTTTFEAYEASLATSDFELRKQTRDAFIAAKAQEELALATLNTARAEEEAAVAGAARSASLAQTAKGALSAAAAQAGLRGATLAAGSAFIAGAAAVIGFGKAIQSAAQFESTLNVFRVTAGATADEMERVGNEAQALGRDITLPGVGAQDAAESMTELSKAGLSVQDSMDGARGSLQLATAAAISNADAVKIVASALNAFSLSGDQATHVADVLANSANQSQGEITDVGLALQQSSAVARQAGLSFEDTITFLTELQRAGIRGSDAGTSLKVSLLKLIAPTDQAAEVLRKLNVQVLDAQGNIRPDVFTQFAAAQEGLSKSTQNLNARIVFGTDGIRTYAVAAREGAAGAKTIREELDKQGTAAEVAGARMTGLAGAAENLKNQLAALGLVIGQGITPGLTGFANNVSNIVGGLTDAAHAAGSVIGPLLSVRHALLDLGKIPGTDFNLLANPITNAFKAVGFLGGALRDTGTDLKFARQNVKGLVIELNKVGGATKVNETVLALQKMADHFKTGDKESQAFADSIEVLIKRIQDAAAEADGNPIKLNVVVPPEVSSGEVGADAAKANVRGFNEQMKLGFGDLPGFIKDALDKAKPLASESGSEVGKLFGAGFKGAVTVSVSQAAQGALDLALAQASGDQSRELRVLIAQRNRQQVFLDRVLARPPATTQKQAEKDVALQTAAAKQLEGTKAAIQSIFDQRAAAAKQAAADAKSKRDKAAAALKKAITAADQKILDAITDADTQFERAVEIARNQGGPGALVKALEALQAQQQRDIDKAKATITDQKTLKATLRQLRDARFQTGQELIAAQKAQQDAIGESFQKRITFEELRAKLTDNDTVLVRAINAYIKYLRNVALPAARKAKKGVIDVKTEIEQLLVQKKELAKAAGESPDVFAARLFQEAADQFRRFGSNISSSATGLLSPQAARGQFAANLLPGAGGVATQMSGVESSAQKVTKAFDDLTKTVTHAKSLFLPAGPRPPGLIKPGNINLFNRPNVKNPKGGFSSVLSGTWTLDDGTVVVLPTVLGHTPSTRGMKPRIVSGDEALKHFLQTGENLGTFKNVKTAEAFSNALHLQQAGLAVSQRNDQLAESKKQTALLQVIARGPRREIKGVTVPRATQETVANIAANVLRGL